MAGDVSSIKLLLQVVDGFTDPLSKAREQAKLFAKDYNDTQKKINETGNRIRQDMASLKRTEGLSEKIKADKASLTEVSEKLKLFDLALKQNQLTSKKSADALVNLRREEERLTKAVEESERAYQEETAALQKRGVAIDKVADHIRSLKAQEESLRKEREAGRLTLGAAREKEEYERLLSIKRREDDREEGSRRSRLQRGKEMIGQGVTGLFTAIPSFISAAMPIREAMRAEANVQAIYGKGLFDQIPNMTPMDRLFSKDFLLSQALRVGKEMPGFDAADVQALQQTAITQGREFSVNQSKNQITDQFLKSILGFSMIDKMAPAEGFSAIEAIRKTYGMPLEATGDIADKIAYTSVKTGADTIELTSAIDRVQGLAANLKVPLETLLSLSGILADFGNIRGRESGTQMLNLLSSLVAPDNETAKELKSLGFSVSNENGGFKSLTEIFKDLNKITSGWSDINRARLFKGVGNQEGISALMTFVRLAGSSEGLASLRRVEEETSGRGAEGTVGKIVGELSSGSSPALDELTASFKSFMIAIGGPQLKNFEGILRSLTVWMEKLTAFFSENAWAGKAVIFGAIGSALAIVGASVGLILGGLIAMGPILLKVSAVLILIGSVITGLIVGWNRFTELLDRGIAKIEEWFFSLKKMWEFVSGIFGTEGSQAPSVSRVSTLSDEKFKEIVREERDRRDREVFSGAQGSLNYSPQITLNAQTGASPEEIFEAANKAARDDFGSFYSESLRRNRDR